MDDALMREQVLLQPEEAGRQVFAQRPLPSVWAVAIAVLLLLAFYAVVAALLDSAGGAATATGGATLVVVLLFASGMIEKHRVCERALLLGPTLPRSVPYVVPVTTIDPGSVRLHHRANFITRRLRQQGTANLRMAPYATKAVSFRGLDPLAAHPRRRQRAPAAFAEPLLRYENAPVTPVVTERWVLATCATRWSSAGAATPPTPSRISDHPLSRGQPCQPWSGASTPALSAETVPSSWPSSASLAMPRKRPCSTTPRVDLIAAASSAMSPGGIGQSTR
jgi:hypothetical protein